MADESTPLVTGRLDALGGVVSVDGRISWFAPEARGFAPIHQYLLREGDGALLIDSGVPVHERSLLAQLDRLLAPEARLSILHTRMVEFDSAGNSGAVLRERPVEVMYGHFPADQWIHFRPEFDEVSDTLPGSLWPAGRKRDCRLLHPGDEIAVDSAGTRIVDVIAAPLRLLATYWVYDRATRTLFTSDSFGHAISSEPNGPRLVEAGNDATGYAEVRDHLFGKFDWLLDADTRVLGAQLATIFETYAIDTIAPGYGCILHGRDVVERHYGLLQQALGEVAARVSA